MANNVDLMVVGLADNISAAELTERLIAEFNQPADAFSELVAAACGDGPRYAAQTGVTLDTAVEGQGKLEELGIVCELVVDGMVISSSTGLRGTRAMGMAGAASVQTDADDDQKVKQDDDELDLEATVDIAADTKLAPATTEPVPDVADAENDDEDLLKIGLTESSEPLNSTKKVDAEPDAITEFDDDLEISFDDDGALLTDDPVSSPSSEEQASNVVLDDIEVDFSDELDILDTLANAEEVGVEDVKKSEESGKSEGVSKSTIEEALTSVGEDEPLATVDNPKNGVPAESADIGSGTAHSAQHDETPGARQLSEVGNGELELTLAADDELPLARPKKKGEAALDDGGLTLVSDDDLSLQRPSSGRVAGAVKIGAPPDVDSDDGESINFSLDTMIQEAQEATINPGNVSPAEIQQRDTSREPVEVEQPVAAPDEEHPEPASDDDKPANGGLDADVEDAGGNVDSAALSADVITDAVDSTDKSAGDAGAASAALAALESIAKSHPAGADAPASASSEDISNFVDSLSTGAGNEAHEPEVSIADRQPATEHNNEPVAASTQDLDDAGVTVNVSPEGVGVSSVLDEPANSASYAPEISDGNDVTDGQIKQSRRKQLTLAVAAISVVGAGALVAFQTGLLGTTPSQTVPAIAVTVPKTVPEIDDSEFNAVAEVSLNAAIERSALQTNPDDYSTEELIAYLSEDLGESTREELSAFISGISASEDEVNSPKIGAAIPADSDSDFWLRNRINHEADKYFDQWSRRKVDLQAYLELQERLIQNGDLDVALDVSSGTRDRLFSVMSLQRLARAFYQRGDIAKAREVLDQAERGTYSMDSEAERVMAIADYAATEYALGFKEDAADSFLKAQILARSMHKPATRTVAFSALAEYFYRAGRKHDADNFLDQAMISASELPVNTAARDLAIRHVALTEVQLGMVDQAVDHANLIVDPFAAVSAFHGIALELEKTGKHEKAQETLDLAFRAGSLITDSKQRDKLFERIKLAGNG